jgi:hypothetical protein
MYEHSKDRLLTKKQFAHRVAGHFVMASLSIAIALGIGVVGYHVLAGLPWVDSLLNASMILAGMGPVDDLRSGPAKVFASMYALFSGLLFIAVLGVVLAPFAHRLLHRLHVADK